MNYIVTNIQWDENLDVFDYLPSEVILIGAPGDSARDDENYIKERLLSIYNFDPVSFTVNGAPDCHIS